ncbi:MAG: ABC-F family ATP-binding cassette domain-containing protein [Myxococcota bacterium]|nr:ABC-F family ATP-binding cassette domain-containing protein [Myxococcota bacterium]
MSLIQLDAVTANPAGRPCFESLSAEIHPGDRLGLIGRSGSGKSTLLRLLAGLAPPDAGAIRRKRGLRVGYMPQDVEFEPGLSVDEVARVLPPPLEEVERELARIEARLCEPEVIEAPARLERVLAEQERWLERFQERGGPAHEGRVRELLDRFRFARSERHQPAALLSGGRKKLLGLLRVVLADPDLLLLDEPDNHLDWRAKDDLESYLAEREGAHVIVSHDRYLLDEVADAIWSLEASGLERHAGGYSAWAAERERRLLIQQKDWADQQKEIRQIEEQIKRFEEWAHRVVNPRHMKQARSRRKRLERMEARGEIVARPDADRRMGLSLDADRGSRRALVIDDLAMGFGEDLLFAGVDLVLKKGERVGLVGPNGCGKTVLLRIVRGELAPLEGSVEVGPSTRLGWYGQEHERLRSFWERSPLELVRDLSPRSEASAVSFLRGFLFGLEAIRQPIQVLSGGERSRLQLACLMLERPSLLLLDEPTNHLDIPSAEVLETALDDYGGAVLVVSHDRYFLDRVVDRVVDLEDGSLRSYAGGYSEYRRARSQARSG